MPLVTRVQTFLAADGRPLPNQTVLLDMPDDFFRIRLVCVLLDTCGMCFDRGAQKKKLDNFLTFFQVCFTQLFLDISSDLHLSIMCFARSLYLWTLILCYPIRWRFVSFRSLLPNTQWEQAVRPKFQMAKSIEEAAITVDEMYNSAYQAAG